MPFLKLENINFNYSKKTSENYFKFRDVTLNVEQGDFLAIMGPNGSGKSTLLKMITKFIQPFSGNIYFKNKNYLTISYKELAKSIAFVPQNPSVSFPYSVYETVMMGRAPHLNFMGFESKDDHKKVITTLELLEIENLKEKGMNEISGGEAQRALIARAIVQEPEVLLLDEPNAHLDIKHQLSIFTLLKKLNTEKNLTVILISHDFNLSNYFSDRVILMNEGKIEFDDKTNSVLTRENIKKIFKVEINLIDAKDTSNKFIVLSPEKSFNENK